MSQLIEEKIDMVPLSNILPEKNQTSLLFIMTSAFWMTVATFIGLLAATELIAPDLTQGLGWIVFGRLRPMHVNLVLFGFVTPGLLGAAFYYLPACSKPSCSANGWVC